MCTVTYIPQSGNDFILSSNRDEAPSRSPQNISFAKHEEIELIFPRDAGAGGTWIAASEHGQVVCLLNGAFNKHKHQPPYRRSRGLMVLDFFTFSSPLEFSRFYEFEGMEPFTFIMAGNGELHELRWDEKQVHFKKLNATEMYIWSSATLYSKEVQQKREEWFRYWKENQKDFGLKAIQEFHRHGGEKDSWNGFIMNRFNVVQTVSLTNVIKNADHVTMIYDDLLRKVVKKERLRLKSIPV